MADVLDPDRALSLARRLSLIPDFPRYGEAVEACAEDLMCWCQGAFLQNRMWQPEDQAEWLVAEARRTFKAWRGTAELAELFHAKFHPPASHQPPPIPTGPTCRLCNGTGWQIVERGGTSGAFRCTCGGQAPVVDIGPSTCAYCKGEKRVLVAGRWQPCSCVAPTRGELRQLGSLLAEAQLPPRRPKALPPTLPPGVRAITEADIAAELARQGRLSGAEQRGGRG